MGHDLEPHDDHRKVPRVIGLAVVCVVCVAVPVAVTRAGVDLLLIVAVCAVALIVERFLGDWLGDRLGPGPASIVTAGCVLFGVWYLLTGERSTPAQRFLDAAEAQGYHSVYFGHPPSPGRTGLGATAEARPMSTTGTSTSNRNRTALGGPAISSAPSAAGPQPTGSAGKVSSGPGRSATSDAVQRTALVASTTALILTPPVAVMGQTIEARSSVSVGGGAVTDGSIEFAVNGRRLEVVLLGSTHSAVAHFTPRAPGTYKVRAQFSGNDSISSSSTIAVLTVAPGK